MRHRRDGRKLGITATHRRAMLANMVTSLFRSERIETTLPKAKEARRLAERLITFARRGNAAAAAGAAEKKLAARRHVARIVQDSEVLRKLFDEIGPRFADRPGGYTRIMRLGSVRVGDGGSKAILELLKKDEEGRKKTESRKTYHKAEAQAGPAVKEKAAKPAEAVEKTASAEAASEAAAAPVEAAAEAKEAAKPKAPKAAAAPAKKAKAHKTEGEKKAKPKAAEKPKKSK
ncbi:MAG: 50S ribosomal protein L17 [Candidatus Krumholzibacteria bacterium]|nr:50S ribosomal protein L17 [Candidatus Krumholzibacteria bacterium]